MSIHPVPSSPVIALGPTRKKTQQNITHCLSTHYFRRPAGSLYALCMRQSAQEKEETAWGTAGGQSEEVEQKRPDMSGTTKPSNRYI